MTYHIYRSTDPAFIPSSTNRIASCVTGTIYADTTVAYGITYYYIVRAEDSTSSDTGPCNNGNIDTNLVRMNASPTGPYVSGTWLDTIESSTIGWNPNGLWHAVNNIPSCIPPGYHSPTHCWYYGQDATCNYETGSSANSGSLTSPIIQAVTASSNLSFWFFREVEELQQFSVDITEVDVSGDGGPWTQVWYEDSKIPSENAWTNSGDISLASFAGQNIQLRFFFNTWDAADNFYQGWAIDDVQVTNVLVPSTCTSSGGTAPGRVLNNLLISKSGANLVMNWSAPSNPCITSNYGVYRGSLPWTSYNHASLTCTTGGTTYSASAGTGSYYYLVVAQNTGNEGSYGTDSSGTQRPNAAVPCLPQQVGSCN